MISNIEARDLKKPNILVQIIEGNFQLQKKIFLSGTSTVFQKKRDDETAQLAKSIIEGTREIKDDGGDVVPDGEFFNFGHLK